MSIDTGKTSFNELQESSAGAFHVSVASKLCVYPRTLKTEPLRMSITLRINENRSVFSLFQGSPGLKNNDLML